MTEGGLTAAPSVVESRAQPQSESPRFVDNAESKPQLLPAYLPWVDLLRFVACFLVIVLHVVTALPSAVGHAGVALFFSISGFLIGRVLLQNRSLPRFYARRFLRIYPAYFTTIALFAAPAVLHLAHRAGQSHLYLVNLPYFLTFTFQLSPNADDLPLTIVWSLCVEELFYLVLPFAFLLRNRRDIAILMLTIIAVLTEPIFFSLPDGGGTWFLFPVNLFFGVLLALMEPAPRRGLPWLAGLCVALLLVNTALHWFQSFGPVSALLCTTAVWSTATTSFRLPRVLEPLRWMGELSYGMYLLHLSGIAIALRLVTVAGLREQPRWLYCGVTLLLVTALTVLFAEGMRRMVEEPALQLRGRLATNRRLALGLMITQVSLIPVGITYAALSHWIK
jgi:peptidoglycan/LPS O-acetylase OafA/YrhL